VNWRPVLSLFHNLSGLPGASLVWQEKRSFFSFPPQTHFFLFSFRVRTSLSPAQGKLLPTGRYLLNLALLLQSTASTRGAPQSCCAPQSRPTPSAASLAWWPGELLGSRAVFPKAGGPLLRDVHGGLQRSLLDQGVALRVQLQFRGLPLLFLLL